MTRPDSPKPSHLVAGTDPLSLAPPLTWHTPTTAWPRFWLALTPPHHWHDTTWQLDPDSGWLCRKTGPSPFSLPQPGHNFSATLKAVSALLIFFISVLTYRPLWFIVCLNWFRLGFFYAISWTQCRSDRSSVHAMNLWTQVTLVFLKFSGFRFHKISLTIGILSHIICCVCVCVCVCVCAKYM